jgi:hypothetical protein
MSGDSVIFLAGWFFGIVTGVCLGLLIGAWAS